MADPHFLYAVLCLDIVALVAWVVYVQLRVPLADHADGRDTKARDGSSTGAPGETPR